MTEIDSVDRYKNAADGKQALEKMNGFDLAGRQVMWENKTCFFFTCIDHHYCPLAQGWSCH